MGKKKKQKMLMDLSKSLNDKEIIIKVLEAEKAPETTITKYKQENIHIEKKIRTIQKKLERMKNG